jgi:hypothetical protein
MALARRQSSDRQADAFEHGAVADGLDVAFDDLQFAL